jgi:hypothetical protein
MRAPVRPLAAALLLAGACAMPPRVLPPSTGVINGAYRLWSCDKPCAFTEEPTKETRFTTLVLFAEAITPGPAVNACWAGDVPPYAAKADGSSGSWRQDADGVVRLVLDQAPDHGAVLHLSVQGDAVTGSVETWACKDGCKQAWYAVDGVRVGKPERSRCGL